MSAYDLRFQQVSRVYSLAWNQQTWSIEAWIHQNALALLTGAATCPATLRHRRQNQLGDFTRGTGKHFGFAELPMRRLKERRGQYVCLAQRLPPTLARRKGEASKFSGRYNMPAIMVASVNLSILFGLLNRAKQDPAADSNQVSTVNLYINPAAFGHGYGLSVEFSLPASLWIMDNCKHHMDIISATLMQAYGRMFGKRAMQLGGFGTNAQRSGPFSMHVPGMCACLGVEGNNHDEPRHGTGYQFDSHNVDNAGQQLSLLAGMARMSEIVTVALDGAHPGS